MKTLTDHQMTMMLGLFENCRDLFDELVNDPDCKLTRVGRVRRVAAMSLADQIDHAMTDLRGALAIEKIGTQIVLHDEEAYSPAPAKN